MISIFVLMVFMFIPILPSPIYFSILINSWPVSIRLYILKNDSYIHNSGSYTHNDEFHILRMVLIFKHLFGIHSRYRNNSKHFFEALKRR